MEGQLVLEGFEDQHILTEKKDTIVHSNHIPSARTKEYTYSGPVYRFEHYVQNVFNINTMAVSEKQAINNIKAQLKRSMGLGYRSVVNIDETLVHEVIHQ